MIKNCTICGSEFTALVGNKTCSKKCSLELRRRTGRYFSRKYAEKRKIYQKEWRSRNRERVLEYSAQYWRRDREATRIKNRFFKARRKGAPGKHTISQIRQLMIDQGYCCTNCKASLREKYQIDHIFPVSRGGSNDISNIQLLCPSCNRRKNAKLPEVWARENGRLI